MGFGVPILKHIRIAIAFLRCLCGLTTSLLFCDKILLHVVVDAFKKDIYSREKK